jgi:hypothetical protein
LSFFCRFRQNYKCEHRKRKQGKLTPRGENKKIDPVGKAERQTDPLKQANRQIQWDKQTDRITDPVGKKTDRSCGSRRQTTDQIMYDKQTNRQILWDKQTDRQIMRDYKIDRQILWDKQADRQIL